jgi:hypothetical protein
MNIKLVLLDLSNCGLIDLAILKIAKSCKKALAVKSVHLSGNPGVTHEVIDKVREILGSDSYQEPRNVKIKNKA